jgi:hypothetical protein
VGPSTKERSFGDRGDRPGRRPGGPGGPRPGGRGGPGGPGERRGSGPRPGGPGAGPRGDRPGEGRGPRRDDRGPRRDDRGPRREDDRPPRPLPPPAQVRVEFLPDPGGALSIAKQIKQSGRAYPLFGTGRLFLERPERHRVRITSDNPDVPLHQLGDGPISFDRASLERAAFFAERSKYYKEEIVEGEPIKGNFSNVAKLRGGGPIIGPTNYHAYQPTLRRLYEEGFSRRMSFPEFMRDEVQILNDEQSIAEWKEQARSTTTYVTLLEEEPITFKTVPEVEAHFRKTYLPDLVKSGTALECSGQASREIPDRSISYSVRDAWERERGFPVNLVNHLRPYFVEAGLHFFKHRKRILYISAVKPVRYQTGQAISDGIQAILNAVDETPRLNRRDLAVKILGEQVDAPEMAEQKAAMARDFHYLAHAGHVLEFHDGAIDLPLPPGGLQPKGGAAKPGRSDDSPEAEREAEQAALAEVTTRQGSGKRTDPKARPERPDRRDQRPPRPAATQPEPPTQTPPQPESPTPMLTEEPTFSQASPVPVEESQLTSQSNELVSAPAENLTAGGSSQAMEVITTTAETSDFGSLAPLTGVPAATGTGELVPLDPGSEHTHVSNALESETASPGDQPLPSMEFLSEEQPAGAVEQPTIVELSAPQAPKESGEISTPNP